MPQEPEYWFPAKRYGWGWGPPITWQGWVVFIAFFVLVVADVVVFPPHRSPAMFIGCIVILSIALMGVCWWKGEPPRWRWGGD